jgi:hypothetical protein
MVVCIRLGAGGGAELGRGVEVEQEAVQSLVGELRWHRLFRCAASGSGRVRWGLLKKLPQLREGGGTQKEQYPLNLRWLAEMFKCPYEHKLLQHYIRCLKKWWRPCSTCPVDDKVILILTIHIRSTLVIFEVVVDKFDSSLFKSVSNLKPKALSNLFSILLIQSVC